MAFLSSDLAYAVVALLGATGVVWLAIAAWRKSLVWGALYSALLLCGVLMYRGQTGSIMLMAGAVLAFANLIMAFRNASAAMFPVCLILISAAAIPAMGGYDEYKKRFPAVVERIPAPARAIDGANLDGLRKKSPMKIPHGEGL